MRPEPSRPGNPAARLPSAGPSAPRSTFPGLSRRRPRVWGPSVLCPGARVTWGGAAGRREGHASLRCVPASLPGSQLPAAGPLTDTLKPTASAWEVDPRNDPVRVELEDRSVVPYTSPHPGPRPVRIGRCGADPRAGNTRTFVFKILILTAAETILLQSRPRALWNEGER